MEEKDLRNFLGGIHCNGLRVKITFDKDCAFDVNYLIGMVEGGIVKVSQSDYAILLAVSASKDWGSERNRTVELELTDKFNEDWFVDRLARPLDKIEIVSLQPRPK